MTQTKKENRFRYVTLTYQLLFKPEFKQWIDIKIKWIISDTKHHKENQMQNPELPCRIS